MKLDITRLEVRDERKGSLYLPAILYLRQSHLRNLIFRPVLQSTSRIAQHDKHAHIAVQVAKEAISTLSKLNTHTPFITTHPLFFKHLLLTAFGNLLLAVVYARTLVWDTVRDDFDVALNLIELLSSRSAPMVRLWQRLQGLRELPRRLSNLSSSTSPGNTHEGPPAHLDGLLLLEEFLPGSPMNSSSFDPTQHFGSNSREAGVRNTSDLVLDLAVGPGGFLGFPFLGCGLLG